MKFHKFRRDTRAHTAIEFAITAPAFFALTFSIVQFGELGWTQLGLKHAVDLAARCASLNAISCGTPSTTQAYAVSVARPLTTAASTFTVSQLGCGQSVSVSYNYPIKIPFVTTMEVPIRASSCFPIYKS